MLRSYLARFPLTDRITFAKDLAAAVCYGAFAGLALPLVPIVARRIGMSPAGITAMVTMQFVGALFGVLFGHLADRRAKMPFVLWPSLFARALGIFLMIAALLVVGAGSMWVFSRRRGARPAARADAH